MLPASSPRSTVHLQRNVDLLEQRFPQIQVGLTNLSSSIYPAANLSDGQLSLSSLIGQSRTATAMGIDAGFDMVPRLTKGAVDTGNWERFIRQIKSHYKNDTQVEIQQNYILFKAGEYPSLPFEGHKLLRFSSKVSGKIAATSGIEAYIETVTRIAQLHFGSRVQYWYEGSDQYGHYNWDEVNESIRSYEQRDETPIHTSIASFLNGVDPVTGLGIPLFDIKEIPGKGRGLIARFDLSKGTRILCEKPLFTAVPMSRGELEATLATKLRALPKASQRQFLSLHNKSPGKYPFSTIFKTNALPCGSNSAVGAVYPTVCLINHSCIPNSHNNWNQKEKHETIHAVRPIKAGEEITIPYDHGGPSTERRAFLKESFGFECTCCMCSDSSSELQNSDARRRLIQSLDDDIGDPMHMMARPKESLKNCLLLLQILEAEYNGGACPLNARVYYDAFQISVAHGDQARGSVFADKAYQARVVCEGEDSPETQRVKAFALKPATHASYGLCSMKWTTKREMMPKGLDAMQFEKWLFRQ